MPLLVQLLTIRIESISWLVPPSPRSGAEGVLCFPGGQKREDTLSPRALQARAGIKGRQREIAVLLPVESDNRAAKAIWPFFL